MGAQPPPTPYIPGEGVNHLTLRAQFHANECNEGRDANPQPQERNDTLTCGTNSLKHMRKSRGPPIYAGTRPITIISLALYLSQQLQHPPPPPSPPRPRGEHGSVYFRGQNLSPLDIEPFSSALGSYHFLAHGGGGGAGGNGGDRVNITD